MVVECLLVSVTSVLVGVWVGCSVIAKCAMVLWRCSQAAAGVVWDQNSSCSKARRPVLAESVPPSSLVARRKLASSSNRGCHIEGALPRPWIIVYIQLQALQLVSLPPGPR